MTAVTQGLFPESRAAVRRIAVGTAQFGLNYGISNSTGQIPAAEASRILRHGLEAGLDTLDTAVAYGDSEACLGQMGIASWRVITKLPRLPELLTDVHPWVEAQVQGSLDRLRVARIDGLLLHRPSDLLGPHGESLLGCLLNLKTRGQINAAGISIYDPRELDDVWPLWRPDIIQAPCSVFDRRLIRSGWLERLQRQGTRLHVRSVFLQGLLLMTGERRPAYFHKWRNLLDSWLLWCRAQHVSPLAAALGFACRLPGLDRVVVGMESVAQLQEVVNAAGSETPMVPEQFACDESELLEPSRWKLA